MPADPKLKQKMGVALGTAALMYVYMHNVLAQKLDSHTYSTVSMLNNITRSRLEGFVTIVRSYLSNVACADLATPRAAVLHTS